MLLERYLYSLCAMAALAGGAWAQTTTPTAIIQTLNFPPIGLASSETAQINVANVSNLAANSSSGSVAVCTGSISFVNANGVAIGTASPFTVTAGKTKSVTLPYSAAGASGRAEIRAVITLNIPTPMPVPCNLVSSMETYDTSSGVTHAYFNGPSGGAVVHTLPMPYPNQGR